MSEQLKWMNAYWAHIIVDSRPFVSSVATLFGYMQNTTPVTSTGVPVLTTGRMNQPLTLNPNREVPEYTNGRRWFALISTIH